MWVLTGCGLASAQTLESALSPGPVIKAHKKAEENCRSCHIPFDKKAQDRLCVECHKDVGQDINRKTGYHGRQEPQSCRSCHTDHKGVDAVIVQLNTKTFDHRQTDYVLDGKHKDVACKSCHVAGKKYSSAPQDCNSCHRKDDVHKGRLGARCDDCHTTQTWKDTKFDHSTTDFDLTGAHKKVACKDCHKDQQYKETPKTCWGCHRKDDKHKGLYADKCDSCHTTQRWGQVTFRHDTDTRYPLLGKHQDTKCVACHKAPVYRDKTPTACVDCHRKDDKHKGSLGDRCDSCHTEKDWKLVGKFDHDRTRFPLKGSHAKPKCQDCHTSLVYSDTPSTCIGCHKKHDKHEGTLGDACQNCHTEKDWKAPLFDHAKTRFPLKGAHGAVSLTCKSCHAGPALYKNTPQDCYACHKKDDKHEGQLGKSCDSCHSDTRWTGVDYDHNRSAFKLLGAHRSTKCADCHKSLRYKDTPSDCYSCHKKDDTHKLRLGTGCDSCHTTRAWRLWRFDHNKDTRYTLEPGHVRVACADCHRQPAPAGKKVAPLGTRCVTCHAKDDVHDQSFGNRCEQCHQATRWKDTLLRKTPNTQPTGEKPHG